MPTVDQQRAEEERLLNSLDQFSLASGGPLFRFYLRHRLATPDLDLVKRRVLFFFLLGWLPLLIIAAWQGNVMGDAVRLPFLYDLEAHIRFLIVVPLFLVGEPYAHKRLKFLVTQFVERGIVLPEDYTEFNRIAGSTVRLRDSVSVELLLVILVYAAGRQFWSHELDLKASTWYGMVGTSGQTLTPAGYWYAFVTIPIFQFLFARLFFRLFLWARLLWQVSRLELRIFPTHPDRAGGLGFLEEVVDTFMPFLFALGSLLAAAIADRVFFAGAGVLDFKQDVLIVLGFLLLVILGPLFFFTPLLVETKIKGNLWYGALASRYADEFERKWIQRGVSGDEPLVGSADIQSLADMGGSFELVDRMRMVPFGKETVIQLLAISGAPLLPLTLTLFSPQEVFKRLLEALL